MPDSELLRCIEKRELVAMAMALAAPATQAAGEFATPQSCNRALRAARALLQLGAYRTQRTHMYVCVRDACEASCRRVRDASELQQSSQSCKSSVAARCLQDTEDTCMCVFLTPVK